MVLLQGMPASIMEEAVVVPVLLEQTVLVLEEHLGVLVFKLLLQDPLTLHLLVLVPRTQQIININILLVVVEQVEIQVIPLQQTIHQEVSVVVEEEVPWDLETPVNQELVEVAEVEDTQMVMLDKVVGVL